MLPVAITRRIFVVPLANNNHGKTTIIRSLVNQGERKTLDEVKRGARTMQSPWGRSIDALIIPRSYQETLEKEFGSVKNALNSVDKDWRTRDLIVFPSHLISTDCATMIKLAHGAGFDAISVPILLHPRDMSQYETCLELPWNERWTLSNNKKAKFTAQIEALGHDLWSWIAAALEHR